MGSLTPSILSPEFSDIFRTHRDTDGVMPFDRFMELALYHPQFGYYRRSRTRVGRGEDTDFYTASTSGPVFGELVAAAVVTLLGDRDPKDFTFIEIGAEPAGGIMKAVNHPFKLASTRYLGDPLDLNGPCVVFSNELFDAQPFRRMVRRAGGWRELGVALRGDRLVEVERTPPPSDPELPADVPENYRIDVPLAAGRLAATIAGEPWTGLFIAFDYGKSWLELSRHTPNGTARAYHRHTLSGDLLDRPGEQDLTCHICWDWLAAALRDGGFTEPAIESQEAFFVRHASRYLEAALHSEAARFSPRKHSLMQLLHPAHLGQKFQVLHASRDEVQNSP